MALLLRLASKIVLVCPVEKVVYSHHHDPSSDPMTLLGPIIMIIKTHCINSGDDFEPFEIWRNAKPIF